MKRKLFVIRKLIISLTLSATFIMGAIPVLARDAGKSGNNTAIIRPTVEYVGTDNKSGTLFHVKLETESPVRFELSIKNENGEVLYTQEFESAKFSKYVKLLDEEGGTDIKLYFTLRTLPNGVLHTFDISSEVKSVKDVVVTKL